MKFNLSCLAACCWVRQRKLACYKSIDPAIRDINILSCHWYWLPSKPSSLWSHLADINFPDFFNISSHHVVVLVAECVPCPVIFAAKIKFSISFFFFFCNASGRGRLNTGEGWSTEAEPYREQRKGKANSDQNPNRPQLCEGALHPIVYKIIQIIKK